MAEDQDHRELPTLCIVKFGGSLLLNEVAIINMHEWRKQNKFAFTGMLCGGGADVDGLRRNQQRRRLTDQEAHWRAVEIMDANTRALGESLGREMETDVLSFEQAITTISALDGKATAHDAVSFLTCKTWMESAAVSLPADWSVSSDSIAAAIAVELARNVSSRFHVDLALLKSADPQPTDREDGPSVSVTQVSENKFCDDFFSQVDGLEQLRRIRILNFATQPFSEFDLEVE